jgi:DNA-binding CsgD family transcriptional regulator
MAATRSRSNRQPERVLADLEHLAMTCQARAGFFDEAAARLRRAVPFDGACWHTLDPGSWLITEHRLQDLQDRFPVLAANEYAAQDVNKFKQLARGRRKTATLSRATHGNPSKSARFRDLLAPGGFGPELRSAFVADGAAWGALILVRTANAPDYDERDIELLERASPIFARAVRRGLIVEACADAEARPNAPGVIELDTSGAVTGASSSAGPLLAELSGDSEEAGAHSAAVQAVAAATRAAIARPPGTGTPELPSSVVQTPSGSWLVLHGGLLGRSDAGEIAVFIQRAHPTLVAPLLLKAFGLTAREQEVTQLVLRGATTEQAAQRLSISPYTVSDHMKAIFEKTDCRTRGELSAKLFYGQHMPRISGGVSVGDDASFLDAPRPRRGSPHWNASGT